MFDKFMDHYRWDGDNLILYCHLQPNAARDEFAGLHGERLKVRIGAPPVDGKANAHLIKFLSRAFDVAKTDVSILKGELGRQKTVCIRAPQKFPEGARIK